jgi:hypothetical protein
VPGLVEPSWSARPLLYFAAVLRCIGIRQALQGVRPHQLVDLVASTPKIVGQPLDKRPFPRASPATSSFSRHSLARLTRKTANKDSQAVQHRAVLVGEPLPGPVENGHACCGAGRLDPDRRSLPQHPSRPRSRTAGSRGDNTRIQLATSSMASGKPSTCRQIRPIIPR